MVIIITQQQFIEKVTRELPCYCLMWDVLAPRATSPVAVPLKSPTIIHHNATAGITLELAVCYFHQNNYEVHNIETECGLNHQPLSQCRNIHNPQSSNNFNI